MNQTSKQFANWQEALQYCVQLHQGERYQEAEVGYRQLLQLQPDNYDIKRLLGLALAQSGRAEEGLPFMQDAARSAPRDPMAQFHMGYLLLQLGRKNQAIPYFEKAARLAPQDAVSRVNLAAIYTEQRKLTLALDVATRAARLAPNMPEAQHNLGFALLESLRPQEAIAPLRRAVELKPAFPEAWMHLGRAYGDTGRLEDASAAYLECLRLDPAHTGAAVNLANVWLRRGNTVDAIDLYQQVLAKHPDRWEARLSLAGALADEDRVEEALVMIEGVSPPPHRARHVFFQRVGMVARAGRLEDAKLLLDAEKNHDLQFWLARAGLDRDEEDKDQDAAQIEGRLDDPDSTREDQLAASFLLAQRAHERKDYPRAFAYYARGHGLMRDAEPYDHASWLEDNRTAFNVFDRLRNGHLALDEAERSPRPVFIVGMPRSGTSLLEQILDSHSALVGGGELVDIPRIAAHVRLHGVHPPQLQKQGRDYLAHLKQLGPEALMVTDKMPHNFQYLGFIALLFPQAHIIYCRRDPCDNAMSIWRQRFVANHAYAHDLTDLALHYRAHEQIVAHWQKTIPNPMLTVNYEDVVADLEGQVRRVLGFLGLDFEPACLEFYKNPRKVRTASRDQVTQPLYATSVGQWRRYAEQLQPFIQALEAPATQSANILP